MLEWYNWQAQPGADNPQSRSSPRTSRAAGRYFGPHRRDQKATKNWTCSPSLTTVAVCAWAMGFIWTVTRSPAPVYDGLSRSTGDWGHLAARRPPHPHPEPPHPAMLRRPCAAGTALLAPPGPPTPTWTAHTWLRGLGVDKHVHLAGGYGDMCRSGRGCRGDQNAGHMRARGM
jgi:hypothetical protein